MAKNTNKTDLRIQRTQKAIIDAFYELLDEKSFGSITVIDICDRALINRGTFYTHFEDKYQLLDKCISDVMYGLHEQVKQAHGENDLITYYNEVMALGINYLAQHRRRLRTIILKADSALVFDKVCWKSPTTPRKTSNSNSALLRRSRSANIAPDGAIRRITASSACGLNSHVRKSTLLSIQQVLSLFFIRISPSGPSGAVLRIAVSSACGLNSHVRKSTLLSIPQALSLFFIEISPSGPSGVIWRTTLSAPLSWMLTAHVAESAGIPKGLCPLTFSPPDVHLGSRLR